MVAYPVSKIANFSESLCNLEVEHSSEGGVEYHESALAYQLAHVRLDLADFTVILPA